MSMKGSFALWFAVAHIGINIKFDLTCFLGTPAKKTRKNEPTTPGPGSALKPLPRTPWDRVLKYDVRGKSQCRITNDARDHCLHVWRLGTREELGCACLLEIT